MEYKEVTRRKFLLGFTRSISVFVAAVGFIFFSCDRKKDVVESKPDTDAPVDPCDDLSGVSENDIALRQKLAYVKVSPIEDNRCDNCNLFLPPATDQKCGGCMLFKGPVHESGYCTYWAPRV